MDPGLHKVRRHARFCFLRHKIQNHENTVYTGTRIYDATKATIVVVDYEGTVQDPMKHKPS